MILFTMPKMEKQFDILYHSYHIDEINNLKHMIKNINKSIDSKDYDLLNNLIAPTFMPANKKIAFFSVQKEFNGYGSNEETLTFSTFDVNNGETNTLLKFNDLSFDNVSAPFYGKVTMLDRFTNSNIEKEVAISKPLYIAQKDLYIIMIIL